MYYAYSSDNSNTVTVRMALARHKVKISDAMRQQDDYLGVAGLMI